MHIKPFDVLLLSSKGFVPKAIQFFTKFEYNHVAIVIPYANELYVVEAQERGFHPSKTLTNWLEEKNKKGNCVAVLRSKKELDEQVMYTRFKNLVGANYEFVNLVFFQLIKVFTHKWFGSKDNKTVICSEAIAWIYEDYFEKPYQVTPKEIFKNENFEVVAYY